MMKYPVSLLFMTMSFLTSFAQQSPQSNNDHHYPLASGVVMKSGTTSDERGGSVNTHRSGTLDLAPEKKQDNSPIYYLSDTAATKNKSYTKREIEK